MSPTDNEIIGGASAGGVDHNSHQGSASVVKMRSVSTGISFSRLANGRVGVSAHDGEKVVGFAISRQEAAELGAKIAALASESSAGDGAQTS